MLSTLNTKLNVTPPKISTELRQSRLQQAGQCGRQGGAERGHRDTVPASAEVTNP